MTQQRLLALGPGEGWHADQLRQAAKKHGCSLHYADYESLSAATMACGRQSWRCAAGELESFQAVLCRTMPMGSMEQVIFRLAVLHAACGQGVRIINPPRTLETAIDKYATLSVIAALGYPVPETIVVQNRTDAMQAFQHFKSLGSDVVVKPIFGGEGRGVMRISDPQLAWTTFSTLQQLTAILYVQRFVPPGGRDTRILILGDELVGIRRTSTTDFRTNFASGATCEAISLSADQIEMGKRISTAIGLRIGSIDLLENSTGPQVVVEVNGVPGWKGAQSCVPFNIAEKMIAAVLP